MNRNIAALITISLIGITRSNAEECHNLWTCALPPQLSDNNQGSSMHSACKQHCDCKTGLVCMKEGSKATCKEPPKTVTLPKANCSKQ